MHFVWLCKCFAFTLCEKHILHSSMHLFCWLTVKLVWQSFWHYSYSSTTFFHKYHVPLSSAIFAMGKNHKVSLHQLAPFFSHFTIDLDKFWSVVEVIQWEDHYTRSVLEKGNTSCFEHMSYEIESLGRSTNQVLKAYLTWKRAAEIEPLLLLSLLCFNNNHWHALGCYLISFFQPCEFQNLRWTFIEWLWPSFKVTGAMRKAKCLYSLFSEVLRWSVVCF